MESPYPCLLPGGFSVAPWKGGTPEDSPLRPPQDRISGQSLTTGRAVRRGTGRPRLDPVPPSGVTASFAAREVSQWGGGARRGSAAPELMSPQGEIQATRAKRRLERIADGDEEAPLRPR